MALRQVTAERGGSRGYTAGTDRAGCGPIVEVPRCFLSTLKAGFFSLARVLLETALLAGRPHRGMECRQRLWMSITGSSSGDARKIARSKVNLHELSPVGRWHQKPAITPRSFSLNPCPFARPRASKSSLACSIPSRLRWHSNVCNQQLAANRLSMPNDSAASLLHRLVRGAVGFPLTRSLGHRRERFRPVVKSGRIKISAIRPNEGVNLWV